MTIVESESETEKNPLEHVHFVALSDVGMRRGENQDSWGIIETDHFKFYIVADGMGGVKGGAVASQLAVDVIKAFVSERTEIVKGDIVGSVGAANYAIFQRGLEEPSLSGMGTTLVGLCFVGNRLLCVNVGDSRAYLVRDQKVTQLTEDHTLIHELLRSGAISEDQVENHPVAHMLTRSLGPTADIQIDCFSVVQAPVAGDRYLLCSDGLYNHLSVEDILRICVQNSIDQAKKELVDLANERGGSDNITVLLIEVGEGFPANIEDTIDFEEDGLTYSQDSKQDEVSEAQDTLDNIHIDDELKNGVPAKSFEEKSVVEMNGAGAEEIVSPEIKQNVDTQLHGRYREEILEKVVAEEEEHLENANKAIQVKSKALRYLSVIVCVAVGTSAYLYWNTSNRFKRRNSAQIAAIAKEIDSAPIDNTLVTAPIEEIPSSVTDPKENLLNTSKEPEEKPAEDSQSIAKEETLDLDSDSSTKLVDDQNQGNQNTETSLSKIDQIRLELERLDQQADRLEQQLASFDQPLSGSTAELLALSSKAVDQISKKMQAIDAQIEENKNS